MKFSFINCHLASGADKVDARLRMASQIFKNISTNEDNMIEPDAISDFNFFMGDLNMRFMTSYTEFIDHVADAPSHLADLDQLKAAFRNKNFPGYTEGKIDFLPTYKREAKSTGFVKKDDQCPSYCDRILFKNNSKCQADIVEYGSHEYYYGSDHRPVFMKMRLKTEPCDYIDPINLLDPLKPVQGRGEICLRDVKLTLDGERLHHIHRTFYYPMFLQLQFSSDWLVEKPVSYEKVISCLPESEQVTKSWKNDQIPRLYTPINSYKILQQKRLLIVLKLQEGTS